MNEQQRTFIHSLDHFPAGEVIVRATGREGIDLEPHSHDCVQLVEAVTGTLRVTVGDREYFVPESYACWIPRAAVHSLRSNNRRIALRIFYFRPEDEAPGGRDEFSVHYVCPWASANFRFIADYGPVIRRDDSGLYAFCLSFFRTFRREERRLVLPLRSIGANTSPALRLALDYLDDRLADNVKMDDAARAAGVSSRTLSRLFSEVGATFSDCLCYRRIIHALELMADNTKPLKEVAYASGFSTPANFNRTFKQVMGVPPSELRRSQKGA
jgi:AraC-like DNA-binding protein/mannose-6-phosphate isomerase-like protein (cupin superfamily)